jgi:hypothetical protein
MFKSMLRSNDSRSTGTAKARSTSAVSRYSVTVTACAPAKRKTQQ